MRVATISDIHLDGLAKREQTTVDALRARFAAAICDRPFDVLVLGGDLSNDCRLTVDIARGLEHDLARPVYYVPGNHDLYNVENGWTTAKIVDYLKNDPRCLFGGKIPLGDGSHLIGHVGWYDYSYGDATRFTEEEFESKTLGSGRWRDVDYIDWGEPDRAICERFEGEIEALYDEATQDRTMLVTHMINHPNFAVSTPEPSMWDFFNAYLGSRSLFQWLSAHPVRAAVCGHVHYRFRFSFWKMEYICACLGNKNEWDRLTVDTPHTLEDQLRDALVILDL